MFLTCELKIRLNKGTLFEWQILFALIALVNTVAGIVFVIFGSGEVQKWGQDDVLCEKTAVDKHEDIALVVRAESYVLE
ncbi:unnamed protein product [Strongylus vulgaris]|uniref:Uncharacterized protein n=1 Tax=Strongylus vulgaris TaxID=40348 RepID=A0A3P7IVE0_STRVU|nr:unnamed protein product [Strongylus vulgaris]